MGFDDRRTSMRNNGPLFDPTPLSPGILLGFIQVKAKDVTDAYKQLERVLQRRRLSSPEWQCFHTALTHYTKIVNFFVRMSVGAVHGVPRATALPRHIGARVTCSSSPGHVSFIKDIAATQPPEHLPCLLKMLQTKGETIKSPGARQALIPLVIPLSENLSGAVTGLLRWPTAPSGMEMPVVEVRKHGVWLLAKNVDQYIHRILVEEDANNSNDSNAQLFHVSSEVGEKLYRRGDFAESRIGSLESYLLKKVGIFPDVLERKVRLHFEQGDQMSAMVTAEFYIKKDLFPGFGRPFVFNAEVLLKVGRASEAKDSARAGLKSPWWTLGCPYKEAASLAHWEDEQIEYIEDKVTEEGRKEDLKKGKELAQIALDEAAFLLDLASVEGTWDDYVERIAECYKEAGLDEIARFILYRD